MADSSEKTNYDSIADTYIAHTEKPDSFNNLYERPFMLSKLPLLRDKNVLDVGCGSGFYTKHALQAGANVTAIDASQAIINRLSSTVKSSKLRLICTDIGRPLSLLDSDWFDIAICSLVIHYLEDWKPLLGELYRVLRKNGELIISTHHPFSDYLYLKKPSYFDKSLVEDTWGRDSTAFKVHFYTRSLTDVLRPILESQFKIVSIEEPPVDEKLKQVSPKTYQRLAKEPAFLFIVLRK